MNIDELKASDKLIYSLIVGSTAYNLNVATSDVDESGIFMHQKDDFLSLSNPPDEIRGDKDTTYYELRKFLHLAATCNPTVIALLFPYPEIVLKTTPVMDHIIKNRHLFITKKAKDSFMGYAVQQIHKAKGNNKRINNPQPKERPKREDFCRFIDTAKDGVTQKTYLNIADNLRETYTQQLIDRNYFPYRPVKLQDTGLDLTKCHVASLEGVPNTYRLYDYYDDPNVKGVFKGDTIVCQTIPKEDEWERFLGFLVYNEPHYESAVREWKQYWEWMANRNEARWAKQEDGTLNYDVKNMYHVFRLLYSGANLLEFGEPIIRFEGDKRKFLLDIRNGKFSYSELLKLVEEEISKYKEIANKSKLPEKSDVNKIDKLYKSCYTKF